METITEGLLEFKILEKKIFKIMCSEACELISEYLMACDRQIMAMRDAKEYRLVKFGKTTIKTLMGEVSYTRRYYKKNTGEYVFLLDEALKIEGGCGLVSENLSEKIVNECTEISFRKAAASINKLTGQSISAMGAWSVVQQYGEKIEKQEERLRELDKSGDTGQLGNVACDVLFEEFDDVWLTMQREKRRKSGAPVEEGRKKTGKKPMHVGTAHTGWSQIKEDRYNTVNKIAYASYGDIPGFISSFEALKRHCFDMDGVQRRIMNGDGASWIKTVAENNDSILQLDPFHRSRAIIRAVNDRNDRKAVFSAINEKDVKKALVVICDLIAKAEDEPSRKRLGELFAYFYNNRSSLLTWQERGIKLPPPPQGVIYRNLGIQESNNCNLITQRMKHRKGSWSIQGGNNMAKILCFRNTIGLEEMLWFLPEPSAIEAQTEPLSAAKAPKFDGKGDNSGWLHAEMPFEQAFKTHGRNAIRGLLNQRSLSDLVLR